jgi:hypothetical protein
MRRVTSIVLALSFMLVSVTGLLMEDGPCREPAPAIDETAGADAAREDSEVEDTEEPSGSDESSVARELHEALAYLLILSGLVHSILNRQALLRHFGLGISRRAAARPTEGSRS